MDIFTDLSIDYDITSKKGKLNISKTKTNTLCWSTRETHPPLAVENGDKGRHKRGRRTGKYSIFNVHIPNIFPVTIFKEIKFISAAVTTIKPEQFIYLFELIYKLPETVRAAGENREV